jgi:hypothetical protein
MYSRLGSSGGQLIDSPVNLCIHTFVPQAASSGGLKEISALKTLSRLQVTAKDFSIEEDWLAARS